MRACFDKNGFLLWLARGDKPLEVEAGTSLIEVPDDSDPNALFLDGDVVVTREEVAITLDRTMLTGSDDTMMLEGLPDPAWLSIDGKPRRVSGGSFRISHAMRVQLVGAHCSAPLYVGYQTWAQAADAVRAERDARLTASDWTQMPDAPVDQEAWRAYRRALRDLPAEQPKVTLDTVVWPSAPSKDS